MKKRITTFLAAAMAAMCAIAEPVVTDVVAKQRYPWNGLVDIACNVSGIDGKAKGLIFDVVAVMPDSSNGRNISHLWVVRDGIKLIDRTVHGNGNYQLLWDAQADLGQTTYSNMVIRVTVRDIHGKVQLWKGGPYWAETNIGAGEPWERGYYFWWGDTTGHKWENGVWTGNFMFMSGSFEDPTYPYAPFWQVMYKSDSDLMRSGWVAKEHRQFWGTGSYTYTLIPEHDAAQVHWGGDWHVPDYEELDDLFKRCDWRWCTTNGVNGFVVRSNDDRDKSIFLPCTGWGGGQDLLFENVYGHYWLSNSSYPDGLSGDDQVSQSLMFGRSFRSHNRHIRGYGLPIRPVQRFSNMVENAGESMPFPLDTTTSLDMIVPLVDLLLIPWNAAWIGGDANATVVIMDIGTEVKRTTGAGEFTYMPAEIGRHDLTYTTLIGDVVQDETYTATVYVKWKYAVVDDGAVITATTQKSGDVTIPDVLNGYPVKGIANDVFKGCDDLASVTVPGSVTDIGTRAFIENRNLHKIVLPVWLKGLADESSFSDNAEDFEVVYDDSIGIYVNAKDLNFTEPEHCLWSGDRDISHDGIASARLKGRGQSSESAIELKLDSPGRLSFWWKASSESDGNKVFDYAYLSIDGVPQGTLNKGNGEYSLNGVAIGGKTGWRQEVIDVVGKGSHVIRWTYAKDEIDEGDTGYDCVWLDEVEFTPLAYLSFDIAGVTGMVPAEISELEGTVVTLPAQSGFEWEDHVFNGWCDGKATYAAESQYVVPATNVTLTAQWIAKRFLTFALDGGEGQIPITIKDVPGADITLPSANGISRTKHVFVGWSDGATTYDAGSNYRVTDASVEFKAVWQRKEAHVSIVSDDVVNGGTVDTQGATISMSACSNPSVGTPAIYYTLDGTEPTTGSTRYEEPFFVGTLGDVTVRALAVLDDCFEGKATFSFTRLPYSLRECVAMEGVNVAVGGATPWFRVTGEAAHDGKAAMRSGVIGDGENSYVEMQVRGEAEVSFWWKISSQNKVRTDKHDYLAFSVDGEEVLTLGGGMIDWTNATYAVTGSGRHSLRWTYIKDGAGASNEDCAWLDDVVWSPTGKLCAVSFDANGGEVSECERKVREGSSVGDLPQPQRYCYDFDGWFAAADGGDAISSETEVTDNVIYYAHWKVSQYTVMFDANGGTGGKTVVQDYGTALSAPMVSREGYTFAGWSPAVPATVPADGATYMAQWKVNRYAVSFDANGGEGGVTNEQDYSSEIVAPEVSRTGYSFVSWSPEVGTTVPASNVVYTAQWSVNQYTATFDANGGSGGKAVMQNYGTELVAPSVTRTGYAFVGWRPSVPTAMPAANRTFVAQWTANKYTVTFDPNGGTGGWSRQMDYGTEIAAPTPTREGYVFNYWLRGRRGDGYTIWYRPPIEAGEKITVADNVTYYAQWTDIAALTQCTVTFNANGGTGSTSRTIEKGVEVGNLPTPIRDGYAFAGWFTAPDGGTQISASTTATADVTYYAHWLVKGPVSFTIKEGVLTSVKLNNETDVTIPDGVMEIGERVFSQCGNLRSVTIPDSVKIIGRSAFSDCVSMTRVTIGNGVIGIGDSAFDRCGGLTGITIPDSVMSIGQFAFASCRSLTHVTIGKSVASVGWGAFSRCSALTSVTIPNSVTSIGHNAFGGCSGLTSVTIPNSVTSIGDGAFDGCVALKSIYVSPGDVDRVIGLVTSAGPGLDVSNVNFIEIGMSRVVFDANGGSVNEASRSVASGRAVGVLPAPTRAGYTFDGWWTMMSGGNKVSASTKVTENVTYYAHWKVNRCTVTFDANGGTGGKTVTQNYGTALTAPTVTRSGYTFLGWFTAANGGSRVSATTKVTANVTYFAHWTKNATSAPDPVNPEPVNPDPVNPDPAPVPPCYEVLDETDIREAYSVPKAVTITGAAYNGCEVVGIVELKLGKVNAKKGTGKVSGSFTGLDGKKHTIKGPKLVGIDGTAPLSVTLDVKDFGAMGVTIGGDRFAGSLGPWHVQSAAVGGDWTGRGATVTVDAGDISMFAGEVLEDLLPNDEQATASGGKWSFSKAASVKWAKPKKIEPWQGIYDEESGKGLIVDTSKGTNLSGLKLTYTPKKGTFKGSFKVYALEGAGKSTKLKKYTIKVNGVVVDGVGYGAATSKKPVLSWSVMVR